MHLSEYANLDGIGLNQAMVRGDTSVAEITHLAQLAIDQLNPTLNAVSIINPAVAAAAATIDPAHSPLAGLPFLVKDVNVFTEDMPTTFSSRFFEDARPRPDSEIVKRWRDAGFLFLGKSNTPEFAGDYVCEPSFRGAALNPWQLDKTTGGSSGGAAAAVASGMVPIAHGTDLGGSIRIPAACCGVFGLKPTSGLCPTNTTPLGKS